MGNNTVALIGMHWKRFVWIWLFPPPFLFSVLVPAFSRYPRAFFLMVDLPLFFTCYYMASKPVRKQEITVGQGMVALVVVPFVLWALLIFSIFGLARVVGISNSG